MAEHNTIKIITAIVTFLVGLVSVLMAFWALKESYWGLSVICILISMIFSYFSWLDYNKLIKKIE